MFLNSCPSGPHVYFELCMDENKFDWDRKSKTAYFHGALSGYLTDENNNEINRLKLLKMGYDHTKELSISYTTDST